MMKNHSGEGFLQISAAINCVFNIYKLVYSGMSLHSGVDMLP